MRKFFTVAFMVLAATAMWGVPLTFAATVCSSPTAGMPDGFNHTQPGYCVDTYADGFGVRDYGPSLGNMGTAEDIAKVNRPRAAEVIFKAVPGNMLLVTLKNILSANNFDQYSPPNKLVPVDILTSLFFDIHVPSVSLAPVSAMVSPGSKVYKGYTEQSDGPDVSGEWAYKTEPMGFNLTGPAGSPNYGISSTGLGSFGPGDRFCHFLIPQCSNSMSSASNLNLDGPVDPDGLQYGLLPQGFTPNLTEENTGVASDELIYYSVEFKFNNWSGGIPTYGTDSTISNIFFQYGTNFGEPYLWPPCNPTAAGCIHQTPGPGTPVPEPTTLVLLLLGTGMLGLTRFLRRSA